MTILGQSVEIAVQEREKQKRLRRFDLVYGCYMFLGLGVTAFGVVGTFLEGQTQADYGMFVFLTLPLPLLATFVITIMETVKSPRHLQLVVLCLIHILFLTAIVAVIVRSDSEGASEKPVDAVILSYGAVFTLVAVWWFAMGRRHNRD